MVGETTRKAKKPARIATIFSEVVSSFMKLEIDYLADVLVVVIDRHLSFYDASYAY